MSFNYVTRTLAALAAFSLLSPVSAQETPEQYAFRLFTTKSPNSQFELCDNYELKIGNRVISVYSDCYNGKPDGNLDKLRDKDGDTMYFCDSNPVIPKYKNMIFVSRFEEGADVYQRDFEEVRFHYIFRQFKDFLSSL